MTELTMWFHSVATEIETNRKHSFMMERIEKLKLKIDNKQSREFEKDSLIKTIAMILGIDENKYPNFLK